MGAAPAPGEGRPQGAGRALSLAGPPAANMKLADLAKEIQTLKSLRHERLIRLHAVCSVGEPVYVVTELMSKGSLQAFLGSECGHALLARGTDTCPLLVIEAGLPEAPGQWGTLANTALGGPGLGQAWPCGGTVSVGFRAGWRAGRGRPVWVTSPRTRSAWTQLSPLRPPPQLAFPRGCMPAAALAGGPSSPRLTGGGPAAQGDVTGKTPAP